MSGALTPMILCAALCLAMGIWIWHTNRRWTQQQPQQQAPINRRYCREFARQIQSCEDSREIVAAAEEGR